MDNSLVFNIHANDIIKVYNYHLDALHGICKMLSNDVANNMYNTLDSSIVCLSWIIANHF